MNTTRKWTTSIHTRKSTIPSEESMPFGRSKGKNFGIAVDFHGPASTGAMAES